MSLEPDCVVDKTRNWVGSKKTIFRLIISSNSSTNPANLTKMGPVNLEIIGLTEIGKNKKQQQNT